MNLFALSPLDGRYQPKVAALSDYFSEAALMKYRVMVEVQWFIFIIDQLQLVKGAKLSAEQKASLVSLYEDFNDVSAQKIKDYEKTTNHDVKAVEYFIKEHFAKFGLKDLQEFVHFACTSEDINNLSYALMIKDAGEAVMLPAMRGVMEKLWAMAKEHKALPMLAHTHGQPASPTTMGKELLNVLVRLKRQHDLLTQAGIVMGKMNGAVGNFNAHVAAYPDIDWADEACKFVQDVLGLAYNPYTTQIEPHDYMAELFHGLSRFNTILLDLSRDIWFYVSFGYFKQRVKEGEVGSSTMPHKVNPIDFENAEGNLGIANSLLTHFAEKLPVSRLQRDLSDSTVQRNIGVALGYSLLSYQSLLNGLNKLEINEEALAKDLDDNWEVLAEPIQTVLRKHGVEGAYEKLKELTRGKRVSRDDFKLFIEGLEIPQEDKVRLMELTPDSYIGLAIELVDSYKYL